MSALFETFPVAGFVRLPQIIGDRKRCIPGVLPISRTSFLDGVRSGKYPRPVKLGVRSVAWRVEDIRQLLAGLGGLRPDPGTGSSVSGGEGG
ncbi:MAG: helix-turn-helix transcriptional regulator [Methylococcales bacterium]